MRINLSKSGVGWSIGGKGLRAGVNAKGKQYITAGRGGFYYRQTFGSPGTTSRPMQSGRYGSPVTPAPDLPPLELRDFGRIEAILLLLGGILIWLGGVSPVLSMVLTPVYLAAVIYAIAVDGGGFFTLRGLYRWPVLSPLRRGWLTIGWIFVFPIFSSIYFVRMFVEAVQSERILIENSGGLQEEISQREVDLGMLPTMEGTCRHCGKPLVANATYCSACGEEVNPRAKICPECHTLAPPDARFCPNCRTRLAP